MVERKDQAHLAGNDVEGSDTVSNAKGAHGHHKRDQRVCLDGAVLVEALLECHKISGGREEGEGERLTSPTDMCGGWNARGETEEANRAPRGAAAIRR